MKILHTEASMGWGGQEIRILTEAEGMRERGHEIIFAVAKGAQLAEKARAKGFIVYEIPLKIKCFASSLFHLIKIIRKHGIDIVNTHSSADAWLAGIAAKLTGCKTIRTRHLSTPSKGGLNSRLLYHFLADHTVTTCQSVADIIQKQANIAQDRCYSIPTGVNTKLLIVKADQIDDFKHQYGIAENDIIIGTACILRSWKGILDLLHAAKRLEKYPNLKWLIVGDGPCKQRYEEECSKLGLQKQVIFTGHLSPPYTAIASMNIFALLSTANEGVSQASLQAAYLGKPLVTTTVGGLPEVAIPGITGFNVAPGQPEQVAKAIEKLVLDATLRQTLGAAAHDLAVKSFTFEKTLDNMEAIYNKANTQ